MHLPGKMSKHLGEMKVGESVAFKGPIPKYPYSPNTKKEIGMVAGGEQAGMGCSTLWHCHTVWQLCAEACRGISANRV
jgi:NAD(P)H-flavin reductase